MTTGQKQRFTRTDSGSLSAQTLDVGALKEAYNIKVYKWNIFKTIEGDFRFWIVDMAEFSSEVLKHNNNI